MITIAVGIVAFGLGVGFGNKVKAFFSNLVGQAKAGVEAEAVKVEAEVKAKV